MDRYRFCRKCNLQVPIYSNYCTSCGKKLHGNELKIYDFLHPHPEEHILDSVRRNRINEQSKKEEKTIVKKPSKKVRSNDPELRKLIEKAKNLEINKAIPYLEEAILKDFDGKYPYDTLIKYYRKNKKYTDEIRVCNLAYNNLKKANNMEYKFRIKDIEKLIMAENPIETSNTRLIKELETDEIYRAVNKLYKSKDKLLNKEINKLINLLKLSIENTEDSKLNAKLYKLIGDMELKQNNNEQALETYENALKLDEKIAVKKIIKKLKGSIKNGY